MVQCLINGPLQAANRAETHEDRAVKRWTCGPPQARFGGEFDRT